MRVYVVVQKGFQTTAILTLADSRWFMYSSIVDTTKGSLDRREYNFSMSVSENTVLCLNKLPNQLCNKW